MSGAKWSDLPGANNIKEYSPDGTLISETIRELEDGYFYFGAPVLGRKTYDASGELIEEIRFDHKMNTTYQREIDENGDLLIRQVIFEYDENDNYIKELFIGTTNGKETFRSTRDYKYEYTYDPISDMLIREECYDSNGLLFYYQTYEYEKASDYKEADHPAKTIEDLWQRQ